MKISRNKKITLLIIFAVGIFVLTQTPQINAFFGGSVSGKVTYDGSGLNNALVSLIIDGYVEDTDYTSSSGFYRVRTDDLLQETIPVEIKVEKNGYTTIYRETYLYPSVPTNLDIEYLVDLRCKGYVYNHIGTTLTSATVKLIKVSGGAVLKSVTTDSNGYYDFTKKVMENLYCKLQASKAGYETQYITLYASDQTTTANFRIAANSADRIAVFFYATDAIVEDYITPYGDQLEAEEGFDVVLYFENTGNLASAMSTVDTYENADDFVFIHIMTHGEDWYETGISAIDLNADSIFETTAGIFNTQLNRLESANIMLLVGACHSGSFIEACSGSGRFIITATDIDHSAYPMEEAIPNTEPVFEHFFFEVMSSNLGDSTIYSSARYDTMVYVEEEYEEEQYPRKSDLCPYTWFKWW